MINFAIHYSGMRICSFWMAIYLFFQLFQVCDHYVMLFVKILIEVASMQLPFTMLPLSIYSIIYLRKWYFVLLLLAYFILRHQKKCPLIIYSYGIFYFNLKEKEKKERKTNKRASKPHHHHHFSNYSRFVIFIRWMHFCCILLIKLCLMLY